MVPLPPTTPNLMAEKKIDKVKREKAAKAIDDSIELRKKGGLSEEIINLTSKNKRREKYQEAIGGNATDEQIELMIDITDELDHARKQTKRIAKFLHAYPDDMLEQGADDNALRLIAQFQNIKREMNKIDETAMLKVSGTESNTAVMVAKAYQRMFNEIAKNVAK